MSIERRGTYTFVFTDIEGSTRLLQRAGAAYIAALDEHHMIIRRAIAAHGGEEIGTEGDAFSVVFEESTDALVFAVAAQVALENHDWPENCRIRVRMGIHTGEAAVSTSGWVGLVLHETARISSAGHGGQVIVSEAAGDAAATTALRDLGRHRLKDLVNPVRLFQLDTGGDTEFPPLRSLDSVRHNLPSSLTTFVGRAGLVDELAELLREHRLVTLIGPGGVGKTRASLELGQAVLNDHVDGVWFVDLAPITAGDSVAEVTAAALGLQEEPGRPLLETLVEHLRNRHLLLVFDNCEHVINGAAGVADAVLRSGAAVRMIATSREPLGVLGERTVAIDPLPVPSADDAPLDPAELARLDAVQLFSDRARLVQSSFAVTADNAAAVLEICRRLDGIPLALELAAARIKILTPAQIVERLDDRFRLLAGGQRTLLPRQQTLRALIDWSYDLLAGDEQQLLRELSVFAGGWTVESAAAIASDNLDEFDLLERLSALVDRSLVLAAGDAGVMRYRLLETIRAYGLEHLADSGELSDVRQRHRAWFLAQAEQAYSDRHRADLDLWLGWVDAENENLRAAVTSGVEDDPPAALRLAGALAPFWLIRGNLSRARLAVSEALAANGATDDEALPRALVASGAIAVNQGDNVAARRDLEVAQAMARSANDAAIEAEALYHLAYLDTLEGNLDAARMHSSASFEVAERAGDRAAQARARTWLGRVDAAEGNIDAAETQQRDAVELARAADDPRATALALYELGYLRWRKDDLREAADLLSESLAIVRRLGDREVASALLDVLGLLAAARGDYSDAAELHEEGLELVRRAGFAAGTAQTLFNLGRVALDLGQPSLAVERLEEALKLADACRARAIAVRALIVIGRIRRLEGDLPGARLALEEADDRAREIDSPTGSAPVRQELAAVALEEGDIARAAALHVEALEALVDAAGVTAEQVTGVEGVALLAAAANEVADAARLLGAAMAARLSRGVVVPPSLRPQLDRLVAGVTATAGAAAIDAGRAMTLHAALADATDVARSLTTSRAAASTYAEAILMAEEAE